MHTKTCVIFIIKYDLQTILFVNQEYNCNDTFANNLTAYFNTHGKEIKV